MNLSIVIPAYNEESRILPTLQSYATYFEQKYGQEVEVLVVVNGSSDGTERVARAYADDHPVVKVLVEPAKVGKGGALLIGFRAARGTIIGFTDADASTSPEAFDDLMNGMSSVDMVIATRWHPDSQVSPRQPWQRRVASRIFNGMVELLFRMGLRDTQCGAKIMRGDALRAVMPSIGITRWAFDVDLLFQIHRAGYRIVERPTVWHDVGGSRLRLGRASGEMFLALIRLRLIYSPFRWIVTLYDRSVGKWLHRVT